MKDSRLENRLLELAKIHPGYGYWKIYFLLRDEGFIVNHKRIYRIYKQYNLTLINGIRGMYLRSRDA